VSRSAVARAGHAEVYQGAGLHDQFGECHKVERSLQPAVTRLLTGKAFNSTRSPPVTESKGCPAAVMFITRDVIQHCSGIPDASQVSVAFVRYERSGAARKGMRAGA
jgi:hypothetical protein